MNLARVRQLNKHSYTKGPVMYWMIRDQRVADNWALHYACEFARKQQTSVVVVFCLREHLIDHHGTARMLDFMLDGLKEVELQLRENKIDFYFLIGEPVQEIPKFVRKNKIGAIVTDFSPLLTQVLWKEKISESCKIPFYEVDTHNIVPCWIASPKQEFGAYTFRPKILKLLPMFLDELPILTKQENYESHQSESINWNKVRSSIKVNEKVKKVDWLVSGTKAGYQVMENFFDRIGVYGENRNDPDKDVISHLSPYFHFGHISPQRVVLEAQNIKEKKGVNVFLEELIIRRELSDNFCFYNKKYMEFDGFPNWAKKTLNDHRTDEREFVYTAEEFERAQTHDELWNAAQKQMIITGKMHGYMRMYWAKKILEWTLTPEEALKVAIDLNDKYELDGRDPNGYVGISWSIGGVHDRAWFERPVYGKVRYMNANGARKKFDTQQYITKWG